jgi:putative DNA methylase
MDIGGARRLIEEYLPIQVISEESRIENSVTQAQGYLARGVLALIHRWWARRPLVACRSVLYATLVQAREPRTAQGPHQGPDSVQLLLERLCRLRASKEDFHRAAEKIREANGGTPRLLDMFAGGGSIPLEAARLGCESYALDLNPVAHLVQLCTVYAPAAYGNLVLDDVRHWSDVVFKRAKNESEELYPAVVIQSPNSQSSFLDEATGADNRNLRPLAYLWSRTVPCKRCGAEVPLHRQTWLRKKKANHVAVRPLARDTKSIAYELLRSQKDSPHDAIGEWGFDPSAISKSGETECLHCRTVVTSDHIKACGQAGNIGKQAMAVAMISPNGRGKQYLSNSELAEPSSQELSDRLESLLHDTGVVLYDCSLPPQGALGLRVQAYGYLKWDQLFTTRQLVVLLTFVKHIRKAYAEMLTGGMDHSRAKCVATYLAFILDRVIERNTSVSHWDPDGEFIQVDIGSGRIRMTWDFPETNPFGGASGSWEQARADLLNALESLCAQDFEKVPTVIRGSALSIPFPNDFFDVVFTDPPYYDNVPYAYLADFFYPWLKRTVGDLYPEHFATSGSPVKSEVVMDPIRHNRSADAARLAYEVMLAQAFKEASRVLRPGAPLVCVYAHKTSAGWSVLVEALRGSGFAVTEAWPIDTENVSRQRSKDSAALATSIFLVARKRETVMTANYEESVRPELEEIVGERVQTLWDLGISGADLVIACVGAGLRAFTRYSKVEYANGEEVPAERFLAEVESVVLDAILTRLAKTAGADGNDTSLVGVDVATRFYVLWRYTYQMAELESGEAIVFANGTHVELDGLHGLAARSCALVEKKGGKYHLLDYSQRGDNSELGMPSGDGQPAPLIDTLHRLLWLIERRPSEIPEFLRESRCNTEQLRLVAQALSGPALKGGELEEVATGTELSGLTKLTANWRSVVEDAAKSAEGPLFRAARENK